MTSASLPAGPVQAADVHVAGALSAEPPTFVFERRTAFMYMTAAAALAVFVFFAELKPVLLAFVALTFAAGVWLLQDVLRQERSRDDWRTLFISAVLLIAGGAVPAMALVLVGAGSGDEDMINLTVPFLVIAGVAFLAYVLRRAADPPERLAPLARDWGGIAFTTAAVLFAALLPFYYGSGDPFIEDCVLALAYVVMALGLNIVVGFAGLLDLGYVAFFAIGAYTIGWLGSAYFADAGKVVDGEPQGVHLLVGEQFSDLPGVHMNFFIVLVFAVAFTATAGALIGLPTLRLRGDYIAIVTLAFGEIIGRVAINGDELKVGGIWDSTAAKLPLIEPIGGDAALTRGRQGITPVDKIDLPFLDRFTALDLRPWYFVALGLVLIVLFCNFRLRDSRLGRAWIALREDEVAAASMGVPLVRTKLMAYAVGAAFGGMSGAFLGSYLNTVNADQFQFAFSIFVLGMIILGGLGSIWGVVLGAIALSFINNYLIPDQINTWPSKVGLEFDLTELSFGIFGFLLVIMMVLRPQGLLPEGRRRIELTEGVGTGEEDLYEARA